MKAKFYFICIAMLMLLSSSIMMCPTKSDENPNVIYYEDPQDCASYFMCDDGILSHLTCVEGLFWNSEIDACDWKFNVDCGNRPVNGDKIYWKEKEGQCECMDVTAPGGKRRNLTGTQCVASGNGRMCTYSGLCNVSGYSNCFIQTE